MYFPGCGEPDGFKMIIYTCSNSTGWKLDKIKELGMGIMITTHADESYLKSFLSTKHLPLKVPVALDNGAFGNFSNGYPFDEHAFLSALSYCIYRKLDLDFVVCPDVVAGGNKSLDFSLRWADRLVGYNKLALEVQDGMTDVPNDPRFSHIFIGGTPEWKWKTAKFWVDKAHDMGKKCHIGQCGTLNRLNYAKEIGADSVDSTNFVRNDSFEIVEEHQDPRQMSLI